MEVTKFILKVVIQKNNEAERSNQDKVYAVYFKDPKKYIRLNSKSNVCFYK